MEAARLTTAKPMEPTRRELEILTLIARGDSNAEIASALGISVHTVGQHVSSLYRKIGVRRRAQAAAYAVEQGRVPAR